MRAAFSHPDLPALAALDALRAAGFEVEAAHRESSTVLDTFDGRLHAAGLRLEQRVGPSTALELRGPGDGPPALLGGAGPPTWPADLPPGPFRERVAAVTKERALLPALTMRSLVHDARLLDRRGKTVVRVQVREALELLGRSTDGIAPTWGAEVLPVAGHEEAADRADALLTAAGLDRLPEDLAATVASAAGSPLSGYDDSPTVPLEVTQDALDAFRWVLRNLAGTIRANLPGTVDDLDPEFLHDLRVAVRRTRSVLAQAKGVLPPDLRTTYRQGFGWLGQVTGPPRDLDVYLLGWADYVGPLDAADQVRLERVRRELEDRRTAAHRILSSELQSARAVELLGSWDDWLLDPTVEAERPRPIGPVVAKRIAAAQDTVLRAGREIDETTPAERLHDLRKDTKKLRYLLECFGGLFPPAPRRRFVGQLKALQDNLGEHQDAEVHLSELRDLARDLHGAGDVDADVLLAMGRLSDHLERRRREERAAFAERFAAYDTKANRRILDDLLARVVPS